MRIGLFSVVALTICGLYAAPIGAADRPDLLRAPIASPVRVLPFPRNDRAQAVWESGACWSECGAQCAWGQNTCLKVDAQGQCLEWANACDRYCQKTCRTSGGPLLNITD